MKPLIALLLLVLPVLIRADDRARLAELFAKGGVITVPPGDYQLDGGEPIPLVSHTTVFAHGARFVLPKELPDQARVVVFAGTDIAHLTWHGGEFIGHGFDPARQENDWEPNASVKGIEITTTKAGGTHDLFFREVRANGMAGAVIGVHGLVKKGREQEVEAWAERVVLESCTLLRSGKFMWDYGYLWQILTWPEHYEAWEVARAKKYFRMDLVRAGVTMADGDDRVVFDNREKPIAVSQSAEPSEALTFLTPHLPQNLQHGRQYFVVASAPDHIKIALEPGGAAIRFQGASGPDTQFVHKLNGAYLSAYAPIGSAPGKGAFDLTGARDVRVTGCQLSALGDTMHIQACHNIVFANNHILGSRMGAFFLAEFCRNATITGNLIDGTNGSRVMSVEKSCTDVTITGNTFRNGGRGSWINQPVNFIMTGNVFVNNTTKNEPDLRTGRRAYQTGEPVKFPELYFTLYEPDATYGPVIVRDNHFVLGDAAPEEAVTFAPNGRDLLFTGNTFQNAEAKIVVDPSCQNAVIENNPGTVTVREPLPYDHGRR